MAIRWAKGAEAAKELMLVLVPTASGSATTVAGASPAPRPVTPPEVSVALPRTPVPERVAVPGGRR